MAGHSHQSIRQSVLTRLKSGEWALGSRIPAETRLAEEYGCARATVNRALQSLAEEGLLVRKRKGGTHVCKLPARQAKFEIPVIREQVENSGAEYRHQLLTFELKIPPSSIRTRLRLGGQQQALNLETVHLADDRPFAFEQRWINIEAVPDILKAPLETISANEWLVQTVPFSSGDVMFSAVSASEYIASSLDVKEDAALFRVDRMTWSGEEFITTMKLFYKVGFQLYSKL